MLGSYFLFLVSQNNLGVQFLHFWRGVQNKFGGPIFILGVQKNWVQFFGWSKKLGVQFLLFYFGVQTNWGPIFWGSSNIWVHFLLFGGLNKIKGSNLFDFWGPKKLGSNFDIWFQKIRGLIFYGGVQKKLGFHFGGCYIYVGPQKLDHKKYFWTPKNIFGPPKKFKKMKLWTQNVIP